MNTGHNSKQTTCLCRDTGGKGMLPAQHTTFNTLDNWGHKPPPNQKGKGQAERLKGHGPEHVYNTLSCTCMCAYHIYVCLCECEKVRSHSQNMLLFFFSCLHIQFPGKWLHPVRPESAGSPNHHRPAGTEVQNQQSPRGYLLLQR